MKTLTCKSARRGLCLWVRDLRPRGAMLAFSALLAVANLPAATEVTTLTDIPYFTYPNY